MGTRQAESRKAAEEPCAGQFARRWGTLKASPAPVMQDSSSQDWISMLLEQQPESWLGSEPVGQVRQSSRSRELWAARQALTVSSPLHRPRVLACRPHVTRSPSQTGAVQRLEVHGCGVCICPHRAPCCSSKLSNSTAMDQDLDCPSFLDDFSLPELNELLHDPIGAPAAAACQRLYPARMHPTARGCTASQAQQQGIFSGACPDWEDCPPGCSCHVPAPMPATAALRRPAEPASSQDSAHAPLEVPQDSSSSLPAASHSLQQQQFRFSSRGSPDSQATGEGTPGQRSRDSARRSHKRKAAPPEGLEKRCQELQSQNAQLTGVQKSKICLSLLTPAFLGNASVER